MSENMMNKAQKQMAERNEKIAENMEDVDHKIVVMSGKGGVGKSTVAANLATELASEGYDVGLMDCDMHGPSIPKIVGIDYDRRLTGTDSTIDPVTTEVGLKVISLGPLLPERDSPVVWRGPLKMRTIQQFLGDVEWGDLDYLIFDLPPGTGDEPLSIAQLVPDPSGSVIVTTPQDVALQTIRRSVNFAEEVDLPVLGIIENMSGFVCPHCGKTTELFGVGGGEKTAEAMNIPFLGRIPFDADVVKSADAGESYLKKYPDSGVTQAYNEIAEKVMREAQTAGSGVQSTPKGGASQEKAKDGIRKIAIPVAEGKLTAHFGHAAQFVLMHLRDGEVKDKELLTPPPHEPGVLPKWLGEMGVDVIIAGGMGQKALSLFEQNGIHVCTGAPSLPPEELVNRFLSGTLEAGENVCDH